MKIGAHYLGNGRCEFTAWAPLLKEVKLKIVSPQERLVSLSRDERGYWKTQLEDVLPGTLYLYQLEGERDRPDPASYFQPEGVHGPSQVVDHHSFYWDDDTWRGLDLSEMIIYELHVGAFTPEGTFEAVIPRLDEMKDLGVNAIEIMPVAQFPGERNWGYDGVYPFAVQDSYGGPDGLKKLVNACHKKGMAVILDVVYNHLGPEGNYLWDYGPYFTDRYKTPWGQAINFDGAYSDEVNNYFIENALYWFQVYHIDALRLDAIHGIFDMSARPFLQELAERVEEFSNRERRKVYLIAESDLNDSRVIRPRELGGYGIDAQWCDDFHHALHVLLTGEDQGYYVDFGRIDHLIKSIREGFIYSGQYSRYRRRSHGNTAKDRPATQFVVCAQNHDQVGNRMLGDRLSTLISFEALKLAAGVVLLSPYIPLLFMGEEYGEEAPFLYFVSHSDADLIEAVREGRKEEFNAFSWKGETPDPQSGETFLKAKINWGSRDEGKHNVLLKFYQDLIGLRREIPALSALDKDSLDAWGLEEQEVLFMRRWKDAEKSHVFCIFNFNKADIAITVSLPAGRWQKVLDSSDRVWHGPGTLLPEAIASGDKITLRAQGLVMYIKKGIAW
ncbi:MAG: malto-oligosyltrehalose trehalohydrolase [Thermodesulfobacteriota bacterium]|nr:malto-oligosyltrehalose trehalohydrolase [Thermodesulfobacteriota bacterium]